MATIMRRKDREGTKRPYWSYVILCADGKRREYRGHPSKADTAREAAEREAKERAICEGVAAPISTYVDAVASYVALGESQGGRGGDPWSKRHAQKVRKYLRFWGDALQLKTLGDIRLVNVEAQVRDLLRTRSAKTARNYVEPLRALCLYAVRRQLLDRDPMAAWSPPRADPKKKTRPLTRAEFEALVKVAGSDARLQYLVAGWTGYRLKELRALLPADLDGRYLCLDARRTKGRRAARQPIPLWLAHEVQDQAQRLSADAPLLQIPAGGSASRQIRRDCDRAKIAWHTPEGAAAWHSLRKTYLTEIAPFTTDPRTLQELARHKDLALTLERYAGTTDERKARVIDLAASDWSCGAGMDQGKEKPAELLAGRVPELAGGGFEPRPRPNTQDQPSANNRLAGCGIDFHAGPIYHVDPTEMHDPCGAGVEQLDPSCEMWMAADRYRELRRILSR
jgi:integrase